MWIFAHLLICTVATAFLFTEHPLEPRIAFIRGLKDIKQIDETTMGHLRNLFQSHPLLIFQNMENISPTEFLRFVKQFDTDHDELALAKPEDYPEQMLQPFDQFPDCNHVAPRGNVQLNGLYNIKRVEVKPYDAFVNNYVWHSDMLGHEYKLPGVVTGFYMMESPQIGGDTDFISGETVYENLPEMEKQASHNILVELNRRKFVTNQIKVDYAGISRTEDFEEIEFGNTQIPLVFAPENGNEKPRILLMPTFFERVVGWTVKESRKWISDFMVRRVLPHRVSIQWRKNDLAVFNNRRFIHSSTPARNYLDNAESNRRLLLQTFIPTRRPLIGIKPLETNVYSCYNAGWIKDQEKSIISAHDCLKFAVARSIANNGTKAYDDKYYVLATKPDAK